MGPSLRVPAARRQQWRSATWRAARGVGRLAHGVALLAFTLLTLSAIGASVLAWRLSQGPLDVGWLARHVESAISATAARSRVHIGEATLEWLGFRDGPGRRLQLGMRDLRVVNQSGAPGAAVGEAAMDLSVGSLLAGQAEPRTVSISGLRLKLRRTAEGVVSVDLGSLTDGDAGDPGPDVSAVLAELGRPAGGASVLGALAQLGRVQLHDAVFELVDEQFEATVRAEVASLDLQRQPEGGVRGTAQGRLGLNGAEASLSLDADLVEGGGTRMRARLDPLGMAGVSQANPALSPLSALDGALQGTATLTLSPSLWPQAADMQLVVGAGGIRVRGGQVPFERVALEGSASWSAAGAAPGSGDLRPSSLSLRRAQATIGSPGGGWPTTLGLSGEARRADGAVLADLNLTLDHANLADLRAAWPEAWRGHIRPWLTDNITNGTARDGAFHFSVRAPEDLSSVKVVGAGGTLLGDDVSVHWFRPVPPVEHAQVVLTLRNPDVLEIAVPTARQGGIALNNGLVRITGLSVKDQFLSLSADVAGQVAEVVGLLRHPRLHLLDRKTIYAKTSAGALTGRLLVDLPLEDHLELEQVKIHALGKLTGLRLGGLIAGRNLDRGEALFDVTSDGLKASGTASIARIPGTLSVEMDFKPGGSAQIVQRATIAARATPAQLAATGLDAASVMTGGSGMFNATYTSHRDGQGEIKLQADLRDAALSLAGWSKPPGQPADATAQLVLRDDKMVGIGAVQAQGPGMQLSGHADMEGDRVALLRLDRLILGGTQATGEVRFPAAAADPIRARMTGPVLDLSAALARKPGRPGRPAERETPWTADVQFDRVLLANGRSIGPLTAHAEHDGTRLRLLQADSTGPEALKATMSRQGNGRDLVVRAADGGAVLRALDLVSTVQGGTLALDGHYDDGGDRGRTAEPVLSGTLELSDFSLRNAPALGKLLQAATIYGVVDALRGPGLQFSQITVPFRYDGNVLEVLEARAFSSSLGITAQGTVDMGRSTLDLKGTVVPAYVLNSMLGRIPLIGRIFSPEAGGGLVAVSYAVRGPLADPSVSANPLSALTPGFLRGLFKIFD